MEQPERRGRRRIDRVTAPDLLDGIGDRPTEELRALRDDCREEEALLSYTRRLVQGRLDIARAEVVRRRAGAGGTEDLVSSLSAILADERPGGRRDARAAPVRAPAAAAGRRQDDLAEDPMLARVPDLDDTELAAYVEHLRVEERQVSDRRRIVLDHLDRLQAELIDRYRERGVAVDDLLATPGGQQPPDGTA